MTRAGHAGERKPHALDRLDRARLRWLADALTRFESTPLPGSKPPLQAGAVWISMDLAAQMRDELVDILKRAGHPTDADLHGTELRLARDYLDNAGRDGRHPRGGEAVTPTRAARAVLTALHEHGYPWMPGIDWPNPDADAIRKLADRLRPSRLKPRR